LKAVELDPSLAEGHTSLAPIPYHAWDFEGALKELAIAIELKPGYATAHHWCSNCLLKVGFVEDSLEEIERARVGSVFPPNQHHPLSVAKFTISASVKVLASVPN
jgi:hypothetical protein